MTYLTYVLQKGHQTGTIHYQGYVQFKDNQIHGNAKKAVGGWGWGTASDGTDQENWGYIWEDEKETNIADPVEFGTRETMKGREKKQGQRSDLKRAMQAMKDGKSTFELMEEFPETMSKHDKHMTKYKNLLRVHQNIEVKWPIKTPWFTIQKPDPKNKCRHWWLWGPPNAGKTNMIGEACMGMRTYWMCEAKYPFEDYDDEDLVIYDDVEPSRKEMIAVTNTWKNAIRVGDVRYVTKYWKIHHTRTVIVLSNNPMPDELAYKARFTEVHTDTDPDNSLGIMPPLDFDAPEAMQESKEEKKA